VINVDRNIDIPFAFGGDGATFAVPDIFLAGMIPALRGTQKLSRLSFGLDLRVGLVKVSELTGQDFWVNLAKVRVSPHMTQSALSGRGWSEAERRVKTPDAAGVLMVREDEGPADANFEGFECRWKNVPNFNGHKLSLLVTAMSSEPNVNHDIYQAVAGKIHAIYGEVANYHPLRPDRMRMALNPRSLSHERRVRSGDLSWVKQLGYFVNMLFLNLAGMYIFMRNIDTRKVEWSHYRNDMVDNTDFRKFDGVLRMVMDGNDTQAAELEQSYNGNHMHFVDGSDGGYALAARGLKEQLKSLRANRVNTDTAVSPPLLS
jgi:hypothetical protein